MEICFSWDHARLAWDAFANESCPLCAVLKELDQLNKANERMKHEINDLEFKLKALEAIQ